MAPYDSEVPKAMKPSEKDPGAPPRTVRRRLTLQDVAKEAGVSPGLASMALSGRPGPSAATAAKVLKVAERLNYQPDRVASMLARRNTGQLGMTLVPSNPYHGAVVEAMLEHAHAHELEVLIAPVPAGADQREALESLVNSRCEALVLLNPQIASNALRACVDGTPTVCLGKKVDIPYVDVIRTDDELAIGMVVDHLVGLGHQHIVHLDGADQDLAHDRRAGFLAAMKRHRLAPIVLRGGETPEAGARAATELAKHPNATAVVAFNDLTAIGLIDALARRGLKVPDDISVTGFDDSWMSGLTLVDLTSIDPRPLEQARVAVDMAVARMEHPRARKVTKIVAPKLVVRGSTARPPKRSK